MSGRKDWTDFEMLAVLDLREFGMTGDRIAKRFGVSRGAILGMLNRIDRDTDRCFPPCDREGTLAPDWWKAGLLARAEVTA